ncbi:EndoU domain-containing protein [Ascidiaceihabitans sp.]|uniref:EndoU domain-containing protein n=1 Tax=Ascidiaceihabitans sp. TaxID=1872644 RepID=UPI0032968597
MPSFVRPFVGRTLHKFGGVSGAQVTGKTEFPEGWTEEDVLDGVSGVGINGEEVEGITDRPGDLGLRGKYKGIEIEVIVDGETGQVRTGYPSPGQEKEGVQDNPPEEAE